MTRPPTGRCYCCSASVCGPHWLYVIKDLRDGAVKIGMTKNVGQRIGHYRANANDHFELRHKRIAGCRFSASTREDKALRALAKLAERRGGDWFLATVEQATACVENACAGYSGAHWK